MTNKFRVPEYKGLASLTPEQLEENKKRLEEMIESWKKFDLAYPELAQEVYCDASEVNWFSFCLEHGRYLGGNCPECKDK